MPIPIQNIRALVEQFPDDPTMRFALGQRLVEDNNPDDLDEAIEHLEFVRKHDAGNAANFMILGKAYVAKDMEDEALEILMEGLQKANAMSDAGHDLIPAIQELLESLD